MSFSDWELLSQHNGVQKFIRSSDADEGTVEVKTVDTGGHKIIDANKSSQIDKAGTRMGDGMEKVASIPVGVMYEWLTKFGVNAWNPAHQDAVIKLLNSSDYRYLKCRDIYI